MKIIILLLCLSIHLTNTFSQDLAIEAFTYEEKRFNLSDSNVEETPKTDLDAIDKTMVVANSGITPTVYNSKDTLEEPKVFEHKLHHRWHHRSPHIYENSEHIHYHGHPHYGSKKQQESNRNHGHHVRGEHPKSRDHSTRQRADLFPGPHFTKTHLSQSGTQAEPAPINLNFGSREGGRMGVHFANSIPIFSNFIENEKKEMVFQNNQNLSKTVKFLGYNQIEI